MTIWLVGVGSPSYCSRSASIAPSLEVVEEMRLPVVARPLRERRVEHHVARDVRHRAEASITGGPKALIGRDERLRRPPAGPQCCAAIAGQLRAGSIGRGEQRRHEQSLVRQIARLLAEESQHVRWPADRMRHQPAGDHRADLVQLELERRRDAEIPAAAADRPEEIGMLVGIRARDGAVGEHHLRRAQVVERHAEARHQPAEAAAERQAGDAGARDDAAGGGEAVQLRLAVELASRAPRRRRMAMRVAGSTCDAAA